MKLNTVQGKISFLKSKKQSKTKSTFIYSIWFGVGSEIKNLAIL